MPETVSVTQSCLIYLSRTVCEEGTISLELSSFSKVTLENNDLDD